MAAPERSLLRRATAPDARDGATQRVTPEDAGWDWVSCSTHRLGSGQVVERPGDGQEVAVVVLEGSADVRAGTARFASVGSRATVFDGPPPPVVLVAAGESVAIHADQAATVLIASAPSGDPVPTRLIDPTTMRVEERGSGQTARRVHHLLPPDAAASRLILVEVFTPGGNWSSYPPHKHDTEDQPRESLLEELYYYRFARPQGFAFARVYTADRSLDEALTPMDGDVVLVPTGVPSGRACRPDTTATTST